MRQQFDTMDVLELQVQEGWPDLPNLIPNPDGFGGAWGWEPKPGVTMGSASGVGLMITKAGTGASFVHTDRIQVPEVTGAGTRQARAAFTLGADAAIPTAIQIRAYDDDGEIGFSPATSYTTTSGDYEVSPWDLPVGTTALRLRVLLNTSAAAAASTINNVVLMYGTPSEVAASDPFTDPPWVDILGPTHEIVVERNELNLSTITATIFDSALDPANDGLIRRGRRIRCVLSTLPPEPSPGPAVQTLIQGTILNGRTTYDMKTPGKSDDKRTKIVLTSTDGVSVLAAVPRPFGVATVPELASVLVGTGVPFQLNGGSTPIPDPEDVVVAGVNPRAKAIDQVAITRDTVRGYAWVSRGGILKVYEPDLIPTTVAATLDEADYTEFDHDFDLERCINSVTVKVIGLDGSETEYGPYTDPNSERRHGTQHADFTIYGADAAEAVAYANAVLAASADPEVRINSVQVPIATESDISAKATLDLYDLVEISNERAGITGEQSRITSIKHTLTARDKGRSSWIMELGFAADGGVAPPQVTPSPGPGGGGRGALDYYLPETYGARGNGTDDDASAVQAAIDAAAAAGGGTVLLSAVYGVTGVIQVKDYVSVLGLGGNGGGATLKALDATAQLRFGDWATGQERIGPSGGFTVDGDGTGDPDGLVWFECVTSAFEGISIHNAGGKGMVVHGAQNNTFTAVDVFTPSDDALTHDYGSGGNVHLRCEIHGSPGRALVLTREGVDGVYPFVNAHNVFKHCIFETAVNGVSLIDIEASNNNRFEDCGISQNASAVMSSGYLVRVLDNPAYPSTPGFTAAEMVSCQFYGGATGGGETDAIYIEGLNQLRVSGHTYAQNTPNVFSLDNVGTIDVAGVVQKVPPTQATYLLLTGGATNGIAMLRDQPLAVKPGLSSLAALMIGRHDESGYRAWISRDGALAWGPGTSFVPLSATLGYDATNGHLALTGGLVQAGRRGHVRVPHTPASGANVVCDAKAASFHAISLTDNAGTISITNAFNDAEITIAVGQDATGGRTITWPTAKYAGGSPPSNTTPNSLTSVTLHYFAGAGWYEISRAVGVV